MPPVDGIASIFTDAADPSVLVSSPKGDMITFLSPLRLNICISAGLGENTISLLSSLNVPVKGSITQSPNLPEVAVISPVMEASEAVICPAASIENSGVVWFGTDRDPPTKVPPVITPPSIFDPRIKLPVIPAACITPEKEAEPAVLIKNSLEWILPADARVIPVLLANPLVVLVPEYIAVESIVQPPAEPDVMSSV